MQGGSQWVEFRFKQDVCPHSVSLTFQGGFAARSCQAILKPSDKSASAITYKTIYPRDINDSQAFDLVPVDGSAASVPAKKLRLTFTEQADFYGRVIMYEASITGRVAAQQDA